MANISIHPARAIWTFQANGYQGELFYSNRFTVVLIKEGQTYRRVTLDAPFSNHSSPPQDVAAFFSRYRIEIEKRKRYAGI